MRMLNQEFHDGSHIDVMTLPLAPTLERVRTDSMQLFWLKASHHPLTLGMTRLFLAISSSVRSNTSNAVALSIRDSPGEIVIDCTPQEMLSIAFLSTNPFKFLSGLNVPAVNVFVPRSAQLPCDFTVLSVSVFALTTCCNHNARTSNDFDFPDAFASADPARWSTVYVKRCFNSTTKEHRYVPCQQHFLGRRATSIELSHSGLLLKE